MRTLFNHNKAFFLLFLWTLANVLTALFSELYTDEAYYWVYTQFPAWGYFDHPPMTAWMIQAGYSIFQNEFGVRLVAIMFSTGFVYFLYKLTPSKNQTTYWYIIFSIFPLHFFGFLAVPDTPFLFFSGLFFYVFKKYLEKDSLTNTVLLGIVIALLFYSKYHAVLVVFFTVIANFALFKRKSFYGIIAISLILFSPHIWWQISNNFPTLQFHLVDRSASQYDWSYTVEYLAGQLFFYGPLLGGILLIRALIKRKKSQFDTTLYINLIGVLVFFFLMSFKGRVEVNWTIPIIVPLVLLNVNEYNLNKSFQQVVKWCSLISLVLFALVRFQLCSTLFYFENDRSNDFKGHHAFAQKAKELAQGLPLVANRYQDAAVLSFYLKEPITSLNYNGRYNIFSMLDFADQLDGKKVMLIEKEGESLHNKYHPKKARVLDTLVFNRGIHLKIPKDFEYKQGQNQLPFTLTGGHLSTYNKQTYLNIELHKNGKMLTQTKVTAPYELDKEHFITFELPAINLSQTELRVSFKTTGLGDWSRVIINKK